MANIDTPTSITKRSITSNHRKLIIVGETIDLQEWRTTYQAFLSDDSIYEDDFISKASDIEADIVCHRQYNEAKEEINNPNTEEVIIKVKTTISAIEEQKALHPIISLRMAPLITDLNIMLKRLSVSANQEQKPYIPLKAESIDKYNGDPARFPQYYQNLKGLIIDNSAIRSDTEKLRRIENSLPDNCKYLMSTVNYDHPDYEQLLSEIKQKLGNPSLLIKHIREQLERLPLIGTNTSADQLMKFYQLVDEAKKAGVSHPSFRHTLKDMLIKKIHMSIRGFILKPEVFVEPDGINELSKNILDYMNIAQNHEAVLSLPTKTRKTNVNTIVPSCCLICSGDHHVSNCALSVEDQRKRLLDDKRCFKCGRKGHRASACDFNGKCRKCKRSHLTSFCKLQISTNNTNIANPTLVNRLENPTTTTRSAVTHRHNSSSAPTSSSSSSSSSAPSSSSTSSSSTSSSSAPSSSSSATDSSSALPVAIATVVSSQNVSTKCYYQTTCVTVNSVSVRIMFDTGSGVSLISRQIVNKLKLNTTISDSVVATTINTNSANIGNEQTTILMPALSGLKPCDFIITSSLHNIKIPNSNNQSIQQLIKPYNIKLKDSAGPIDMLIGLDLLPSFIRDSQIQLNDNLRAQNTTLGWVIFGTISYPIMTIIPDEHQTPIDDDNNEDNEDEFLKEFISNNQNIHQDQITKRYTVKFPIIDEFKDQQNVNIVKQMLISALNKMTTNERIAYQDEFNKLIKDQIISPIKLSEIKQAIPHFIVSRQGKETSKLRIVYNASFGHNPINNQIFKGMTPYNLISSLLNFRLRPIAIVADLKQAFYQINLHQDQKKWFNILWIDDNQQVTGYRFNRVPFGVTASPFALYVVIHVHLNKIESAYPETVEQIKTAIYVDDIVHSVNDEEKALKFFKEANQIFSMAAMTLKKWNSSSHSVNQQINDGTSENKILGLEWSSNQDKIHITIPNLDETIDSKRKLLSLVSKIYDPLGLLAPLTTKIRLLIQSLWHEKLEWDEPLPKSYNKDIASIKKELEELKTLSFSRYIGVKPSDQYQLIMYVDASKKAIAAIAYLTTSEDNNCYFLWSKSKLIKFQTIANAECMAINLALKMIPTIKRSIKISAIIIFSDSAINVCRFQSALNKLDYHIASKVYLARQLKAIIQHVPSQQNPADLLSRAGSLKEFIQNMIILKPPIQPSICATIVKKEISWPELKSEHNWENYVDQIENLSTELKNDIDEQHRTFIILIKIIQKQTIQIDDYKKYILFKDLNGIIRLKTRLENANLTMSEKYPIFLNVSPVVETLLIKIHEDIGHGSVQRTAVEVRKSYFIPKLWKTLKRIIRRCRTCEIMFKKPDDIAWASLPVERTTIHAPFEVTGLDLFDVPKMEKSYGIIFVCANTRMVHLEPLEDQQTSSIIMAFRKFVSIYRLPAIIISDNAPNLTALAKVLIKVNETSDIQWKFTTPGAPNTGGLYEALIKSIKRTFKAFVWSKQIKMNDLPLIFYETAAVVNNRPLFKSEDVIITPTMMTFGAYMPKSNVTSVKPTDVTPLEKFWINKMKTKNNLWRSWIDIYIKMMVNTNKNQPQNGSLDIGDTVLMVTSDKRQSWPIGIIVEKISSFKYRVQINKRNYIRSIRQLIQIGRGEFVKAQVCQPAEKQQL